MNLLPFVATANSSFQFDIGWFIHFVFPPSPALLGGLAITISVAVIAQAVGVVRGVLSALAGMSRSRVLRGISGLYVWFFRGTPLLVQLFLVYFGTPYLFGGIDLFPNHVGLVGLDIKGAVLAGIVAFSVNEGAYMSEIVRAGILSIDPGQTEAAKSLGMTYRLTMMRIVLPQALRVIIPPLGNEFNNMLKTTSLLSVIAVEEIFRVAQAANSASFKTFEAFLGVALYYLALTTIWSAIQGVIERRLGVSQAGGQQASFWSRMFGFARRTTGTAEVEVPSSGGH